MALLKRLYRTKATKQHLAYQKYVKKTKAEGKKPHTFKYWSREPVYFRGIRRKGKTVEERITEADAEGRQRSKLKRRRR